MVVQTATLPALPRVRLVSPQVVFASLSEDRRSVVHQFAGHDETKRQAMANLLTYQPDLSLRALKTITGCIKKSSGEAARIKLEGFLALYRHHPGLQDEVLTEIVDLVNGSNSPEAFQDKLSSLDGMLKIQPNLSPLFVKQLRLLVDSASGVPARALSLDAVRSMLAKNPSMTPEMVGAMRGFVIKSKTADSRRLKLAALDQIMQYSPGLDCQRVKAIATAVDKDSEGSSRRILLKGMADAFRWQPGLSAESLQTMGKFVYQEPDRQGMEERANLAVRLVRLAPDSGPREMGYVADQAAAALTPLDGTLRARLAVNDLLVAHHLEMSRDQMMALAPLPSPAGATVAAGLLHPDSALSMAQDSLLICKERAQHFTDAAALPSEKMLREYEKRSIEVRGHSLYKIPLVAGVAALVGGAGGMLAQFVVPSLTTGGVWGIAAAAAGLSLIYAKNVVDRDSESHVRRELCQQRDFWSHQLAAHERVEPTLEALLATRKTTPPGVHETETVIVVGSIRVRRRPCEEE